MAVVENVFFNEITLWPLLVTPSPPHNNTQQHSQQQTKKNSPYTHIQMQKDFVVPVLKQYQALNNRDASYFADLLKGIEPIWPDIYGQPSIKPRAFNTLSWPSGREPFQTAVQARAILQN